MSVQTVNKHGLNLKWPRLWIIILGIILIILCFCIAGMEVGHTLSDLYRSTAFGGFIVFLPFIICAFLILITAFKPRLTLLRITVLLCFIMIILCFVLIVYDILVLIDPTQCFFLSCSNAVVNASNSTTNVTVTGWPLTIAWPSYFQANMNAKRIFQSIQILCAALFILFLALYILTYFIYRRINLDHPTVYNPEQTKRSNNIVVQAEPSRASKQSNYIVQAQPSRASKQSNYIVQAQPSRTSKRSKHIVESPPSPSPTHLVAFYSIVGRRASYEEVPMSPVIIRERPRESTPKPIRATSVSYEKICTRCLKEPRMILLTVSERQNYFSHLCLNCNKEILHYRHKGPYTRSASSSVWKS